MRAWAYAALVGIAIVIASSAEAVPTSKRPFVQGVYTGKGSPIARRTWDLHADIRLVGPNRYKAVIHAGATFQRRYVITSAQIVAARKLLGRPRDRLAPKAGVSATVLRKIEHGVYARSNEQLLGIQIALERAGVGIHSRRRPQCEAAQGNEETGVTAPPRGRVDQRAEYGRGRDKLFQERQSLRDTVVVRAVELAIPSLALVRCRPRLKRVTARQQMQRQPN